VALKSAKDGRLLEVLAPELRFYPKNKETTTEVALRMGQREDVYLVLAGVDESGTKASFKIFINPLQVWLWYGAMIMVLGGIVVAIPLPRQATATQRGREHVTQTV
jgi:cytochrome c-type biogenesis protein CcmF